MATDTAAPRGTYDNPATLDTPYGPVTLHFAAWPSYPRLDARGSSPILEDEKRPPHVGASLRSPIPPEVVAPRGYIDGHSAFVPLVINGIPYRVDSYFTDETGAFLVDRSNGYYTQVKRLSPVGAMADGRLLGVSTIGGDEPTDKARAVAHREIEPLVIAELNGGRFAAEIDAARWRAVTQYAEATAKLRAAFEAVEIDAARRRELLRQWANASEAVQR